MTERNARPGRVDQATVATPSITAPSGRVPDGARFESSLRGYDRRQVDEFIARQDRELTALRAELEDSRRLRRLADDHATATEAELRQARRPSAGSGEDGFGFRAEKLLRLAEQEAAEVRSQAARESAALIEQARTRAEEHRHEVEQGLIGRATVLEQHAAERAAELGAREQEITDQLAAAREQADELHAGAVAAAARLRKESESAAEGVRRSAAAAAQREQERSAQEVERLTALQADVRSELGRLAAVLSAELTP